MTRASHVGVYTLRTEGLDEAAVSSWRGILDATELERAARFVFSRHRVVYIAAHALVRSVLSRLMPDARPADWHFAGPAHTKPVALLGGSPAPISFNLSHTEGMVGVAAVAAAGWDLGFDIEALDRNVTLEVADRYFRPEEVAWLYALPPAERPRGFLRLWTLKEAFIKATGQGLSQDLASFWFTPELPRIHFTPALRERPEDWWFDQRVVDGSYIAALGLRRPGGAPEQDRVESGQAEQGQAEQGQAEQSLAQPWGSARWHEIDPRGFAPEAM